ncbi:MAG: hypothetical protein ACXW05_12715 [Gemmatirosa sp.]
MSRVKSNNANRGRREVAVATPFEEARDELFQHIMSCGVIGSDPVHQTEWFDATMSYMKDRFPEIPAEKLQELRTLGERFAQPPKRQAPATSAA